MHRYLAPLSARDLSEPLLLSHADHTKSSVATRWERGLQKQCHDKSSSLEHILSPDHHYKHA